MIELKEGITMPVSSQTRPLKTIRDRRLAYLVGLQSYFKEEGFTTKLDGRNNILEVYERGTELPKTEEETVIEKWID